MSERLKLIAAVKANVAEADRLRLALETANARIAGDNAVCLCGCPASEHEDNGEDGEQCEHEDHECLRVAPAVLEIVGRVRRERDEARERAETWSVRAEAHRQNAVAAERERDNHRDRAATMSLMLDTIEGVATGQPGEIPTTVEDGWSTALAAVIAALARPAPPADAATEAVEMQKVMTLASHLATRLNRFRAEFEEDAPDLVRPVDLLLDALSRLSTSPAAPTAEETPNG